SVEAFYHRSEALWVTANFRVKKSGPVPSLKGGRFIPQNPERPCARCVASGAGPAGLASGGGTTGLGAHDEGDLRRCCVCSGTHRRRERGAGQIQSRPDRAHGHGGDPHKDPNRGWLLPPWASRVCVLVGPAPTVALVSPALVICQE